MEDYKEEIKDLLQKFYSISGKDHKLIQRTTSEILSEVRGVIPHHPIDEHDIYELMKEMGFKQDQLILYKEVYIVEEDKKKGIEAEYDKVETGRIFVWNLYQI